jgi:hypothetical protein
VLFYHQRGCERLKCWHRGFSCTTIQSNIQTCEQLLAGTGSAVLGICSDGATVDVSTQTVPLVEYYSGTSSSVPVTVSQIAVMAPLIDIRWQASDTTKSTSTKAPAGGQESSRGSSPGSDAVAPSSGLSSGAEAGIGVAVAIAVIAVLLGAVLIWRRKRRSGSKNSNFTTQHELQGNPLHELEHSEQRQEMMPLGYAWNDKSELRGSEPERHEVPG